MIIMDVRLTCRSMTFKMGSGPDAKPTRSPDDMIFERLSNRSTRPISGSLRSRAK